MNKLICTAIVLLSAALPLNASLPTYAISERLSNTLFNNNGLVPIPANLLSFDIQVMDVNDSNEFVIQRTLNLITNENRVEVYLPAPAHGLPAGFTTVAQRLNSDIAHINNHGQVASTVDNSLAFLWFPEPSSGLPVGINFVGSPLSIAYGLNDHATLFGAMPSPADPSGPYAPFTYYPQPIFGQSAGIHFPFPNFTNNAFGAVNNNGWMIAEGSSGPFVWLPESAAGLTAGQHDLLIPPLPGPLNIFATDAYGLNDLGQIVGKAVIFPATTDFAFLWQPDTGLVNLNSLLPPDSGWVLNSASGINNLGQIIGTGTYLGQPRPFLLTPLPEPCLSLATCGLAPLVIRRSRSRPH
jgi:hypothetical protein